MSHIAVKTLRYISELTGAVPSDVLIGGSGARVIRLRSSRSDGDDFALKFLSEHDRVVDGHDLPSFRRKIIRQHRLARDLPGVYEPIAMEGHGDDHSWFVTRWIAGSELLTARRFAPPSPSATIMESLPQILNSLAVLYSRECVPGHAEYVREVYLGRVSRRLSYLLEGLRGTIGRDDVLSCCGSVIGSPAEVLQLIPATRGSWIPQCLYYPVHGDLNSSNLLLVDSCDRSFRLIDPGSSERAKDLLYDLGKLVFSVSFFDLLRRRPVVFRTAVNKGSGRLSISMSIEEGWRRVAAHDTCELHRALNSAAGYQRLLDREGAWERALVFVVACHALAESACRLSHARICAEEGRDMLSSALACLAYGGHLLLRHMETADGAPSSVFDAAVEFLTLCRGG
ncbi:hypothetical protein [Nonomuraea sp. NPDC048901]|uniref:hypothetical protein n=1 Tax=Nonomuraea sp. NPDC048901 TaxID=3155627 RepID=UPI0033C60A2E